MQRMVDFYNIEVNHYKVACEGLPKEKYPTPESFANKDATKISWSSSLMADFSRLRLGQYRQDALTQSFYRPFQKQWLYFDGMFNHRVGQMPCIFPDSTVKNRVICLTVTGK